MPTAPSLTDLARREVVALRRHTEFDVFAGGTSTDSRLVLCALHGTRTRAFHDLVVAAGRGVGGRALVEHRPVVVDEYATSPTITHDYDHAVTAEGIVSLTAVPVMVRGRVRGALYGGRRRPGRPGDRCLDAMVRAADQVSRSLEIEEEVARRASMAGREQRMVQALASTRQSLRELTEAYPDNAVAPALRHLELQLTEALTPTARPDAPHLTPRERDLITHLSLGLRNAEIAERLHLREQTVKTYVRDLLAKLCVRSRHEAVVVARAAGLLP